MVPRLLCVWLQGVERWSCLPSLLSLAHIWIITPTALYSFSHYWTLKSNPPHKKMEGGPVFSDSQAHPPLQSFLIKKNIFPAHYPFHWQLNSLQAPAVVLFTYYLETPILWPPDAKNWLTGKDPDAGKDWGWEEKGMTESEMAGWHHRLNGHESGWTPGAGDGQGGLVCCGSWGSRVGHDWANELNWTELNPFPPLLLCFPLSLHSFFLLLWQGKNSEVVILTWHFSETSKPDVTGGEK